MNKKILIPVIVILILAAGIGAYFIFQKPSPTANVPYSFFTVHLEAGTTMGTLQGFVNYYGYVGPAPEWQETFWPSLVNFVKLADKYDVKLTLEFNPQWVEYILSDNKKLELVKEWHTKGHEIGLHHHVLGRSDGDWDGYTNDASHTNDPLYRGTMDDMMRLYNRLGEAINDKVLTGGTGGFLPDFPKGIIYETKGIDISEARSKPEKVYGGKVTRIGYAWLQPRLPNSLSQFKEEFNKAQLGEIFGVATHEYDFYKNPGVIEEWFKFLKEKGIKIDTARKVIQNYPAPYSLSL